MRRIGIGLLTLLLVLPAAWALDDSKDKHKDKPDKKPATPAEPADGPAEAPVADLMAVLRRSVEEAKRKRGAKSSRRAG